MGVSSKIFLHKNASTEKVFEVILKVTGNKFEQLTFSTNKNPVNFSEDPSEKNSWYLEPKKNSYNYIKKDETSYFQFNFCDFSDNRYFSNYHIECDEYINCINGMKLLYTPSSAAWIAIGKKIVDFFGGEIVFSDSTDYEDRFENNNVYICSNPKFDSSAISSNEKFYSYYKLLNTEKNLSSEDILWAKDKANYFGARDKNLLTYIEKLEEVKDIKDSMVYRKPDFIRNKI